MIESLAQQIEALAGSEAPPSSPFTFDGRHPKRLDHSGHAVKITAGHLDVFAVSGTGSNATGPRRHLFRVEKDEIILDLQQGFDGIGSQHQIVAVGSPGVEAIILPRTAPDFPELVASWIKQLAWLITESNPSWDMQEVASGAALGPGERRRSPARHIIWVSLASGSAKPMGLEPAIAAGGPPLPLTAGMWIEAGPSGCHASGNEHLPEPDTMWPAIDQFHLTIARCVDDTIARDAEKEAQRLVSRSDLMAAQTIESFDRLANVVIQRPGQVAITSDGTDPLLAACQLVAEAIHAPFAATPQPTLVQAGFAGVVEIARSAHLRVRRTLLRGEWWNDDSGPLIAWHGEARNPVALIRPGGRRYVMHDPRTGMQRPVDRALAMELSPHAASFYPALPAHGLRFRDLLAFAFQHGQGNFLRIAFGIAAIGLLSLVTPLVTKILINSVIPRSEIDQLVFCGLALAVTALAIASVQTMQGLAMLRVEGTMDWKLQAAVIDRVLRLPTALFRAYTVGDFVDRAMGIDAARRVFTGRALRSMTSGLFAVFSVALMLYYDIKLGLVALLLTLIRALVILAVSGVRLYHETRYFGLQGRIGGFVLQLITGIGKLRVADATTRALAVWSRQFALQKRNFLGSQRASNVLGVFETAYPLIATLVIFAAATYLKSKLLVDIGGFLAFFSAFGQSMASIGAFASGVSEALIAIPHISRLRPLISGAAEFSDDRKSPGELAGMVELSRVTFRYASSGPPVLENVSIKIAQGEYVAIVGPSGSGKSSLFRLLLGFEKPESGTVFLDGKAIDTLDISAVRRQLGVVLQNGKLASGSLYDNICGGVQLPLEHAWEAARLAGLEDDIKAMPMGMNTVVSEGVNTLSGGQRQRIMIARAVARRPRILLFDEATSALDNRSQAIVSESLGNLNVTRLVIAHRLSTVRQADRIIVLVDGKVAQAGSYAELSSTPGVFASFAQRQLL
jgi:NHLM bacteriocin system ABC transporter ATP-binding protein